MSDLLAPPPAPKLWTAKLTRFDGSHYIHDIVSYELAEGIWFLKTLANSVCAVPIVNYMTVDIYPQEEDDL